MGNSYRVGVISTVEEYNVYAVIADTEEEAERMALDLAAQDVPDAETQDVVSFDVVTYANTHEDDAHRVRSMSTLQEMFGGY